MSMRDATLSALIISFNPFIRERKIMIRQSESYLIPNVIKGATLQIKRYNGRKSKRLKHREVTGESY